eukprot:TRINITY_DN17672_c0_g1_i1.p1 TRINITY_DN17672_c0_g1~~TRINITY_DN17672_c0_g1_i1.p1  ORF type:complete len:1232 (+),score=222.28 TRINITY_DN17672_c0_g1_i1:214-3909(+)
MPKVKKRTQEQRAATFAVRSGTAKRTPLTQEEAEGLFWAIDAKDAKRFGIRSLSGIDVDGLHDAPSTLAMWEPKVTLLHYAAWRRRDHFVAALLRAGADPGARYGATSPLPSVDPSWQPVAKFTADFAHGATPVEVTPEADTCDGGAGGKGGGSVGARTGIEAARRELVASLRPELAVWVVRALARLRLSGVKVKRTFLKLSNDETPASAAARKVARCGECGASAADLAQPLAWERCGHICCESPCFWEFVCGIHRADALTLLAEMCCPACGGVAEDIGGSVAADTTFTSPPVSETQADTKAEVQAAVSQSGTFPDPSESEHDSTVPAAMLGSVGRHVQMESWPNCGFDQGTSGTDSQQSAHFSQAQNFYPAAQVDFAGVAAATGALAAPAFDGAPGLGPYSQAACYLLPTMPNDAALLGYTGTYAATAGHPTYFDDASASGSYGGACVAGVPQIAFEEMSVLGRPISFDGDTVFGSASAALAAAVRPIIFDDAVESNSASEANTDAIAAAGSEGSAAPPPLPKSDSPDRPRPPCSVCGSTSRPCFCRDWVCENCAYTNFSKRRDCRNCAVTKCGRKQEPLLPGRIVPIAGVGGGEEEPVEDLFELRLENHINFEQATTAEKVPDPREQDSSRKATTAEKVPAPREQDSSRKATTAEKVPAPREQDSSRKATTAEKVSPPREQDSSRKATTAEKVSPPREQDSSRKASATFSEAASDAAKDSEAVNVDREALRKERRDKSHERWAALPREKANPGKQLSVEQAMLPKERARAERKFRALDVASAARARLGDSQAERTEEFFKAASACDMRRLEALMEAGVDIDATDEYGQTALFLVACRGHLGSMRSLLEGGASYELPANGGSTAAVGASANGHVAAAELLFTFGADPHAKGSEGLSAAEYLSIAESTGIAAASLPSDTTQLRRNFANATGIPPPVATVVRRAPPPPPPPPPPKVVPFRGHATITASALVSALLAIAIASLKRRSPSSKADRVVAHSIVTLLLAGLGGGFGGGAAAAIVWGLAQAAFVLRKSAPAPLPPELPAGPRQRVEILIDSRRRHPGAGSCIVDFAFEEDFLRHLEALFASLPVAPQQKASANNRSYFCDTEGWVRRNFNDAILAAAQAGGPTPPCSLVMAHMRFLHYENVGGGLPPHIDLARTDSSGNRSTHTFIIYLTDCERGGQTVLLKDINDEEPLAEVHPRRGRLLLFPHQCPHLARPTVQVPKLLLRGEAF